MRNQGLGGLSASTKADLNSLLTWPSIQKRWAGTGDTLAVLDRIGEAGEASSIAPLMSFALAPNEEVREKARSVIRQIFDKMPIDRLPILDESLRQSWAHLQDWYGLKPKEARAIRAHSHNDWLFLALLSCHRDGFVRAEALRALGAAPPEIAVPFIIIRIVDWVREVRLAAEIELQGQMKLTHGKPFVDCLGLLDRLSSNSRYRVGHSTWIETFLKGPEHSEAVAAGLHSRNRLVRRHSFRVALDNPGLSKKMVLEEALSDRDVLVRKWAFKEGPLQSHGDEIDWTTRAASDPYGPIRRRAFDALAATESKSPVEFERYLLDRSTEIRRACQSLYTTRFAQDPARFYRMTVQGVGPKRLEVAIRGLSETGDKADRSTVRGLLANHSARVRRASIQAFGRLGVEGEEQALLRIVASDTRSVARDAASVLLRAHAIAASSIWSEALKNPDVLVPLVVIRLFKAAGKWQQLKLYLEASASTELELSECGVEMLAAWVQRFNRSFAQPSAGELADASIMLTKGSARMPGTLRSQLDFILKTIAR